MDGKSCDDQTDTEHKEQRPAVGFEPAVAAALSSWVSGNLRLHF